MDKPPGVGYASIKGRDRLRTALTHITAAGVHHPAAAGVDHVKTATVVGNTVVAATRPVLGLHFSDVGFLVGHDATSLVYDAPPFYRRAWCVGSLRATRWQDRLIKPGNRPREWEEWLTRFL